MGNALLRAIFCCKTKALKRLPYPIRKEQGLLETAAFQMRIYKTSNRCVLVHAEKTLLERCDSKGERSRKRGKNICIEGDPTKPHMIIHVNPGGK